MKSTNKTKKHKASSRKTVKEKRGKEKNAAKVVELSSEPESKPDRKIVDPARNAEDSGDFQAAEKLYKEQIEQQPSEPYAYDRLMIVYRKQKKYKEELEIINKGIRSFQDMYAKRSKKIIGNSTKLKQLSNSLLKSLKLSDNKGNALYEPEPIPKWKKRKEVVEKKIKSVK